MARIKYCPNCHFFNAPAAMQCSQCGRDIGNVKAITEENAKKKEEQELLQQREAEGDGEQSESTNDDSNSAPGDISNNLEQYIECEECHYHNLPTQRTCAKCGEPLAGIPITKGGSVENTNPGGTLINPEVNKKICSMDGEWVLELDSLEIVLGRQAIGKEYLEKKPYVGRNHAKITVIGSDVYLEDLNSTNGTYIDGQRLEVGKAIKLCTENIIGLGGNATSQTGAAFLRLM